MIRLAAYNVNKRYAIWYVRKTSRGTLSFQFWWKLIRLVFDLFRERVVFDVTGLDWELDRPGLD